jgi:SagB-type dehydrogenase family enzyme
MTAPRRASALLACVIAGMFAASLALAQAPERVALPAPQTDGGKPLMQALKERRSTRAFDERPLPPQTLANLLWASFGINRPDTGGRTAPSARNWQEIDVYVVMREGAYRYDAKANALEPVAREDLRALAGTQSHARQAPLTLVYVSDAARTRGASEETRAFYSAATAGSIAQNAYLFCASEGLGTVVFASIDREPLARALGLGPGQRIVLAQSIGYPRR